ncbi:HlyD family type I secretion periplasmic adaptor subunit [Undibacterium sp. Rencai35W]|uniref:HlyD family type I secretion periplasmic adaptor subunit n=1 Tax=Undibacterium sp. Rencai35W TaxID=3413046 RepID=UPI003BF24EF4
MKKLSSNKSLVTDVANQNVEILEVNTDAAAYARLGWGIVIFGVLGFLLWASFAPLDKGVPLSGNVVVASNRKAIQHQTGGTVDAILVKDGDVVKAGQVLLKMNSITANSTAEISKVQWYSAQATEARLMAERDGAATVTFPKELEQAKTDPRVANNILLQQQLFSARRTSLQSELGAYDENISGLRMQLKGLEESMVNKKQQQQFLKEQLEGMRDLAKDGYIARNRLLDLERTYAQVNGGVSEDIGNMGRVTRQIAEFSLRKIQRQQDYQKEVRTQLSDVQKEAESLQSRLDALNFDLNNTLVKAPVDGTVVGLSVFTKGAVVSPGFKLMELVPKDDALIVEGMLPVNLVDKVHEGLKAELIFSAFNTNTTPHIPGIITQVSADRTVDERTGQAYYKVKASVAPEGMKLIAHLQIRPGMPVEMFVKTGQRTMMNYLMKPVFDRANSALTEE